MSVGGLNEVKVFNTADFSQIATIPVGKLPHGVWPSGDGSRVYVGLENADELAAIDTLTNMVIATVPNRPGAAAVAYVAEAVPEGDGKQNLQPLGNRRHGRPSVADSSRCGQAGGSGADQRLAVRPGADAGCCRPRSPASSPSSPMCWRWPARPTAVGRSSR